MGRFISQESLLHQLCLIATRSAEPGLRPEQSNEVLLDVGEDQVDALLA
jgi:hypothetical protein